MRDLLTAALLLMLPGCIDTSPDRVQLKARVEDPALSITPGSLVVTLSGGFTLVLEVGDLAAEEATIDEPPSVQLVTAEDQTTIRVLDAVPGGTSFPLALAPDTHQSLAYVLSGENTLPASEESRLCSEAVRFAVTLRDSLSDRPTTASSEPLSATGCP